MHIRSFFMLFSLFVHLSLSATEHLRIEVISSNNYRLNNSYQRMLLPERIDTEPYLSLQGYAKLTLKPRQRDEIENLMSIAAWVHKRWAHDPYGVAAPDTTALQILRAAEQGARYSCSEYSKVLRDVFRAYGYVARIATLQANDIAYGGLGTAHVAVEVYSSQLNKWIFLDPQWGLYPQHQGLPLNLYEYHRLVQEGKADAVQFLPFQTRLLGTREASDIAEYREFLSLHLGYLSVDLLADEEKVHVLLALQGKSWPLTFQGLPRNAQIYSTEPNDVYFELNRVSLVLNYRLDSQPLSKRQIDFSSEQDYLQKMPLFAAVPDFQITAHNNMPWFSHYEARIDKGIWKRLRADSLDWNLKAGSNHLEIRAVNQKGRAGTITNLDIRYQR